MFFCVVLHPIIQRIAEEVPDLLLNGWYLDEGTIVGKLEDIKKAVSIIRQDGPARGLFLSTEATSPVPKSTMWCPDLDPSVLHPVGLGIPRIQEPGIVLLGSPVGDKNCVHTVIEKKIHCPDHRRGSSQ